MKWLSWIMKITLGLVLVFVIGVTVLLLTFDANKYRDQINQLVYEQTGRELTLDNISLILYPSFGLSVTNAQLTNAKGFAEPAMIKMERLHIGVALMPLLDQNIRVNTLKIDGLAVFLARNTDGVTNWQDLLSNDQASAIQSSKPSNDKAVAERSVAITPLHQLEIDRIHIQRASLRWQDQLNNQDINLDDLSLRTHIIANVTEQIVTIKDLELRREDLRLTAQANITQLNTTPVIRSQLAIEPFNPRKLLNHLQITLPEMANPNSLTQLTLSLNSRVTLGDEAPNIALNNLKLELDNSQLNGQADFQLGESLLARWDLALNQINLNDYLPPKPLATNTSPTQSVSSSEASAEFVLELPNEPLRRLDLMGKIGVQQLTYDQLHIETIRLAINAQAGVFNLTQFEADVFNTQATASAQLDLRGNQPKLAFTLDSRNIPIDEVIRSFVDFDRLSGTGLVKTKLTTSGDRMSQWQQNLNGQVTLNLRDGAVKGFNLAKSVRDAQALLSGQATTTKGGSLQTDFSALDLRATIKQGVVTTERLTAEAPFMRMRGEGKINLPKQTLNYLVHTRIVASAVGQNGADLTHLAGLTIPVKLTGRLMNPRVSVDLAPLLEGRVRQDVEKQKEELGEQLQKELEERGNELLNDLRKRLPF